MPVKNCKPWTSLNQKSTGISFLLPGLNPVSSRAITEQNTKYSHTHCPPWKIHEEKFGASLLSRPSPCSLAPGSARGTKPASCRPVFWEAIPLRARSRECLLLLLRERGAGGRPYCFYPVTSSSLSSGIEAAFMQQLYCPISWLLSSLTKPKY